MIGFYICTWHLCWSMRGPVIWGSLSITCVLDKSSSRQSPRICWSKCQPTDHTSQTATNDPTDDTRSCGPGPGDGHGNGHHGGGDQDTSEVVGPGQVQVDNPAEQTQWNWEKGADDNAPVLVVEKMFLILLVVLVNLTCQVGLDNAFTCPSSFSVSLLVNSRYCTKGRVQ